ncbi:hypothetical protein [Streptomyces sp. NPDC053427]|uniref:hypothetical protein n=1 Tax=Streptomyces sp. NPDC053427 TaxID=3365701 RepID=UPI0037CD5E3F
MGGTTDFAPVLAVSSGLLYAGVRGLGHKIYYRTFNGRTWTGFEIPATNALTRYQFAMAAQSEKLHFAYAS